MNRRILFILMVALLSIIGANAQKQSKTLKFNADGSFKILQLTDIHYIDGNPKSDRGIERLNEMIEIEKPDLIIVTGDLIFGKPGKEGMHKVISEVSKHGIPFGVTFGNHDDEQGLSRRELFDIIASYPGNLTDTVAGISGVTNFIIPIKTSDGKKDARIIYCFDSNSYTSIPGVKGYDHIKFDQIDWYRKSSQAIKERNGNDTIPALAFFHIPLPEYRDATSDENVKMVGFRKEHVASPKLNSGLYISMKEMGDVNGVFCGHDHDNDFAVNAAGILLAYGRYTGGDTVYNNLPNGARVIVLKEGTSDFTTYIVTKGGKKSFEIEFPKDLK